MKKIGLNWNSTVCTEKMNMSGGWTHWTYQKQKKKAIQLIGVHRDFSQGGKGWGRSRAKTSHARYTWHQQLSTVNLAWYKLQSNSPKNIPEKLQDVATKRSAFVSHPPPPRHWFSRETGKLWPWPPLCGHPCTRVEQTQYIFCWLNLWELQHTTASTNHTQEPKAPKTVRTHCYIYLYSQPKDRDLQSRDKLKHLRQAGTSPPDRKPELRPALEIRHIQSMKAISHGKVLHVPESAESEYETSQNREHIDATRGTTPVSTLPMFTDIPLVHAIEKCQP